IERKVKVEANATVIATLSFQQSAAITASNVDPEDRDRLDDMANIYFRMRQYVDWVKLALTTDLGPTVRFLTFADTDPTTGDPIDDFAGFYRHSLQAIVMGLAESEYENRDGIKDPAHHDDAPENSEWHEYTHHLYQ